MGTFNERAEKLMDTLSELADNNREANMLQLINGVTLDVIAKVSISSPQRKKVLIIAMPYSL